MRSQLDLIWPVARPVITQSFGARPEYYQPKFGIKSHNGIDLWGVGGEPVLIVDDGKVVWVRNEPGSFGLNFKVQHSWGDSHYAHLRKINVKENQVVKKGDVGGELGNTGNSTGNHLHYGMRYMPYDVNNGWYGYTNPEKHLPLIDMRFPLGVYMLDVEPQNYMKSIERLNPSVITLLWPSASRVNQIRNVLPNVHIVGRYYKNDAEYENKIANNPEEYARNIHGQIMMTDWKFLVDSVMTHNEVLAPGGHYFSEQIPVPRIELKKRFDLTWMGYAQGAYQCEIGVFSEGTPDIDEKLERWPSVYHEWDLYMGALEYAEAWNHYLSKHEYGFPRLLNDNITFDLYKRYPGAAGMEEWHSARFIHKDWPYLKQKVSNAKVRISEWGYDALLYGVTSGWLHPDAPNTSERAAEEICQYMLKYRDYWKNPITDFSFFAVGSTGGWDQYDPMTKKNSDLSLIDALADRINEGSCVKTAAPPIDDENTDDEPEKDMQYRNLSEGIKYAGIEVIPLHEREDFPNDLKDTDQVRVLVDAFTNIHGSWEQEDLNEGEDIFQIPQWAVERYYIPQGEPCWNNDQGGATYWFGMLLENRYTGGKVECSTIHHGESGFMLRTEAGLTVYQNAKKDTGWANVFFAGSSAYYIEDGQKGTWTVMPFGYSDIVKYVGLPNRWHISEWMVWQLMTWAEYKTIFLTPVYDTLENALEAAADNAVLLPIDPDGALTKRVVYDMGCPLGDILFLEGDEFYVTAPEDGAEYVARSVRNSNSKTEVIVYYTVIGKWGLEDIKTYTYHRKNK